MLLSKVATSSVPLKPESRKAREAMFCRAPAPVKRLVPPVCKSPSAILTAVKLPVPELVRVIVVLAGAVETASMVKSLVFLKVGAVTLVKLGVPVVVTS